MKRILLVLAVCLYGAMSYAGIDLNQHLNPEEFKAKQRAFLTEKAALTTAEADKFFPIFFELDSRKRSLNDQIWKLLRSGDKEKMTDAQYEEMLLKVYDLRIESSALDKQYYEKFRAILPPAKIYKVQRAEAKFHREMLKDFQKKRGDSSGKK